MNMEPQIKEVMELAKQTDILIFGIGEALHMAAQRHITDAQRSTLRAKRAVGEAWVTIVTLAATLCIRPIMWALPLLILSLYRM